MKIMSFNTQHCVAYLENKVNYDTVANAIRFLDADIVGLNEMYDDGENARYGAQTEKLSKLTGLKEHYFARAILDCNGPYGNALFSKYKIIKAETIPINDPNPRKYDGYYESRCILKAMLENGYTVLVSHFGLNPDEVENAVRTVVENLATEKCILMGDFNVAPDNELLAPIREKMVDTANLFSGERLSWPSNKPEIKIDYIFVTRDIEVISADIPDIVASDHRPHIAVLK